MLKIFVFCSIPFGCSPGRCPALGEYSVRRSFQMFICYDIHLLPDVLREGVQLLANVLCEGLDEEGMRRPPVNHRPCDPVRAPGTYDK